MHHGMVVRFSVFVNLGFLLRKAELCPASKHRKQHFLSTTNSDLSFGLNSEILNGFATHLCLNKDYKWLFV